MNIRKQDSTSAARDLDVVYFSWTGNTKKVVDVICEELRHHDPVSVLEIKPKRNYPYAVWLFLSCIPGIGVTITCGPIKAPTVILAMPKWTVNCPPISTVLRKGWLKKKDVYLVITYGGFDQDRYAASYRSKIARASAAVRDVLLVKRRKIQEGDFADVKAWTKKIARED